MNIYLIITLILYALFLALFPLLNSINNWFPIQTAVLYIAEVLTLVNIYIIFYMAKFIKLHLKNRLGNGMTLGVLHTPAPFAFAGEENLLYADSSIFYYNSKSETFMEFLASRTTKNPHDHFKKLKNITLFADEIFFKYGGEDIPFTRKFKRLMRDYAAPTGLPGQARSTISYRGMIELIKTGRMGDITIDSINDIASYESDGKKTINYDTEFLLHTRSIRSDDEEDLLIGLDKELNPDINAFRYAVEDNVKNMYPLLMFVIIFLPILYVGAMTLFLRYEAGLSTSFIMNMKMYLYGTFFQIPFYYFLGWKYITHYNQTTFFSNRS